jgi:hypothetical protein
MVMFGLSDIPKFFFAFFLVLPLISILHEAGHVFFAWLMGGKNIKVTIGSGKKIFQIGMLEVRKYYFWYGLCSFENLKRKKRLSNILVFLGGSLFNALAAIAVAILINNEVIEAGILTYQFTYFSWYYVFFALLPMPYPDGNYSDGKIILDLIKNKKEVIEERTYRMKWEHEKGQWHILDHENQILHTHDDENEAFNIVREIADKNRPSRILNSKDGEEKEIQNFPRIPL